ncbi:CBS domain-containing protein [Azonexus hydrophilus]|uniref:CBS domain-containing protein n=1 Tax=Azonexus hydrophilus TaxID=418702 RepID=UPI001963801B|nr:CBS domain-containing protein [Azonexus hydrophilus]MDX9736734.1 CBS domain-containing protein [Azonexus sp.]
MKTLKQLLAEKNRLPVVVSPKDMVFHALQVMADNGVGAVLVMDGERLVGIFSERDYARKIALANKNSKETPVSEVMTSKVAYVTPENTVSECMTLMTEHRFRHLPVLGNEGELLGLVSIGDMVKATIREQKFIIAQLEHYIAQ